MDAERRGLLALPVAFVLVACDWVDSTGRQSGDAADDPPLVLEEAVPTSAGVDGALGLAEGTTPRVTARRTDAAVIEGEGERLGWGGEALAEGALEGCTAIDDFRAEIAATTLAEACASDLENPAEDCALAIEREGEGTGDTLAFTVSVPRLRAPVGVRRALELARADGTAITRVYDFCLISINEAPLARDDAYVLAEGETLVVEAGSGESLLANDSDDEDAANAPLAVDPTPVRGPERASAFTLGDDGGFSYTFPESGIRGDVVDSFVYRVSDGVHPPVEATVTLRVVAGNLPPALLVEAVPPLVATVGELFEADLAVYLADPEGEPLALSLSAGALPPSGAFALDDSGRLVGVALEEDIGDYSFVVLASDGERGTAVPVTLSVVAAPNRAPLYVAGSIGDLLLERNDRVREFGAEFVDPDGDPLVFELIGEPPEGLVFDPDGGTLSGRARERGITIDLAIRAVDPSGAAALSEPFSIVVF